MSEAAAMPGRGERPTGGPIYIGGLDRCGKTTLRSFLTCHPNIAIPAVGSNMETYFLDRYGDLSDRANFERCLDAMMRYKHVRFLDPDPDRIRREFLGGPATYPRLFSLFLIQFAEREGKPRWGVQTGLAERYADVLFDAYAGLKVIHMLRDPRDRYEASLARWPDGRGRAGGATARWRYTVRLAERNLRRYPDDYMLVRFEDLVADPEGTLREVCAFVGEDFREEMLAMPEAPKHRALLRDGRHDPAAPLLSDAFIGRFRGRVPLGELAFMQLHGGRAMRRYGYSPDRVDLSPGGWARFAAVDWPVQFSKMVAWRGVEWLQQRFPGTVSRKPDARMMLDPPEMASR